MKRKVIVPILAILFVVAVATFFLFTGKEINKNNPTPVPTVTEVPEETPTVEPTAEPTVAPVETPIIEPTEVPVVEPTTEPGPTVEPTKPVVPTETPTVAPTAKPTPTNIPTVAPTATPTPSPTPMVEYKIDGKDVEIVQTFKVSETTYIYVYENGNTGIADTKTGYIAKCLTKFKDAESVDIVTVTTKLMNGRYFSDEELEEFEIEPQYLPTPTPTPTPFPTPNPDKPKMLASYKGDENYGDVTVEAWDNGYLYVKGSGVLNTSKIDNLTYTAPDINKFVKTRNMAGVETTHIVIKEGITELNDWPLIANKGNVGLETSLVYLELPSTLEIVNEVQATIFEHYPPTNDVTIVGYKDGQKVTYEYKAGEDFSKVLKEQFGINSK